MAKQKWRAGGGRCFLGMRNAGRACSAVHGQQVAPHRHQPLHIGLHAGFVTPDQLAHTGQAGFNVHRAGCAQGPKTAVHFSANAARQRPLGGGSRPERFFREFFRQVFGDGQAVPHHQGVIDQHRHLAHRGDGAKRLFERGLCVKAVKAHQHFFKVNARLLEQHPRPHGPGRVVFIADVQLEHAQNRPAVLRLAVKPLRRPRAPR